MLNLIIDGFNLPLTITATYHEIAGKAAYLPDIQQYNIRSLLITGRLYYLPGYVYPFQKPTSIYWLISLYHHNHIDTMLINNCAIL